MSENDGAHRADDIDDFIFKLISCDADSLINSAFSIFPATKPLWNATYSDLLKKNLLMTYDKFLRPTEHFNKTSVTLSQSFVHVGLDEMESVFQVHSLTRMVCELFICVLPPMNGQQ